MLKKMRTTLFTSILSIVSLEIYAESSSTSLLQYAQPCEDVKPQSKLLLNLQNQININYLNKEKIIVQFWKNIEKYGAPMIERIDSKHSRIIYLWKGAQQNVRLIGGPSNDHEWLTRLKDTDVWFKESIVDNRFIGSYSFTVDLPNIDGYLSHYCPHLNVTLKESRAQRRAVLQVQKLDPFNNKTFLAVDDSSQLRNENILALSNVPNFVDPQNYPKHKQPELVAYTVHSQILKNDRKAYIYKSKAIKNKDYITAIFFDGEEYAKLLNVSKALDILVQQGKLPPIQAIFVAHPSSTERPKELTPNAEYSQFFREELIPWVDQQLKNRNKQKTVILGSSLGGLSSAYLGLQNPNEISHIVPLSGSFWWQENSNDLPNGMSKIIREQIIQPPQHWYISANTYESSRNNNELSILETAPIVAQDLKSKGHDVTFKYYVGGHSYAIWQVILQDALIDFFAENK